MASIEFHNFRSNDMERSFSLEDAYQRYGAWGGIHDFDFDALLDLGAQTVTGTGGGWNLTAVVTGLPTNFNAAYHKTVTRQGVGIFSPDSTVALVVGTDSSGYPTIWWNGSIAQQVPVTTPSEADVEVVLRQQVLSDIAVDKWLSVTVYMNGAWVTSYSRSLSSTIGNLALSVGAYSTDVVPYTSIRVPELCETTEFGTLDPGEEAYSGFRRTIEGRYLYSLVRWDGSLRAWRRKQRDRVLTLDNSVMGLQRTTDLPQLCTHARMMGAYVWSEAVDWTLVRDYGHRFREENNPMLLTEEECQAEAVNTLKRAEESAFGLAFQAQHVPLLEPEDRIQVRDQDWVINDYNLTVGGGEITQTYTCRRYVWGEP